ncbi:MAG: hypothetical protein HFJ20_04775 [Clostridia bacterium]|nr:hypothetical protein [Clostridia bacterium]
MLGTATKLKTARNIKLQGAISGNANFDGSANITINTTQTNIKIISGNATLTANTNEYVTDNNRCTMTNISIKYPTDFSSSNCRVLSTAIKMEAQSYYTYGWSNYLSATEMLKGVLPNNVALKESEIILSIGNLSTNAKNVQYEIVLIKTL